MKLFSQLLSAAFLAALTGFAVRAEDAKSEDGFVQLYNGKDLTGWQYSAAG